MTGGLNAWFRGGGAYVDASKVSVFNRPYQGTILVCAGHASTCGGDGDSLHTRSGSTVRQLRPSTFSFSRHEGHGSKGYGDWSVSNVALKLGLSPQSGETRIIMDLAERCTVTESRERNAKMLWEVTKLNIVR